MKIIQWLNLKIIALTLTLSFSSVCHGQVSTFRLHKADSLFQAKQYTQSFEQYRTIFEQKEYTPAMLLRMAYIQEGLSHMGEALYYLNLYYLASNDKTVLVKMEELADKHRLEGYDTTDADQFLSVYHDYHFYITLSLGALAIFLMSLMVYTKTKKSRRPLATSFVLVFLLVVFFVHVNFGGRISTGIIAHAQTYVMDGPSAAAAVVEIVDDGHRVEVVGKHDIWLKILWNGETAYVKQSGVLPVQL